MRVTLQNRITTTIIIFVIILISAFTIIQLQNQLKVITIFNSLKARLSAQILKDSVRRVLSEGRGGEDLQNTLQQTLESLRDSDIIEEAFIYSADGKILASTQNTVVNKTASVDEMSRINEARWYEQTGKKVYPYIHKPTRNLQLYIPISDNNSALYIARVDFSLGNMSAAMQQVYIPVILTAALVILANVFFVVILSKRIIGPISLLNTATKEVAAGDLDLRIHMNSNDELEELAETFNIMTIELKKMKEKAENANPLTKLPGNIVISEEVEKRIKENRKFTVIYCDLDNFKAFNDKYGIHAGDEAIKLAAAVFKEAVAQKGNPGDFIGHEGGDDFILLTTPDKAQAIGDYITSQFDSRIRTLYSKEDLDRGYIEAKSRHSDEIMKFPIMTISLAGVSNEIRPISSYGEVTNIAAEVKKKAKKMQASCFVVDQRKMPWPSDTPRPV